MSDEALVDALDSHIRAHAEIAKTFDHATALAYVVKRVEVDG